MRKGFAMVLAAFFLLSAAVPCGYAEESGRPQEIEITPALTENQVVVYNNHYNPDDPCSPMVYITGLSLMGRGLTIRVYDSADTEKRSLLGYYEVEDTTRGFTVEIPVSSLSPWGGSVYVTNQKEGASESAAVRADYDAEAAPTAQIDLIRINEEYNYEQKEFANGWPIYTPQDLKAGTYYLADVKLTNFHTVGGVTIPIWYNTDYLELVPISPSTKLINKTGMVSAADGAWFNFAGKTGIYKASLQCGVLPGFNSDYGTVGAVDDYPIAKGADPGEYPYLNTSTGLVKLEAMKSKYGAFNYRSGNWRSGVSVVRLVFRAKQSGSALTEMTDLVHFATAADYVAAGGSVSTSGKPDDSSQAEKYYATQHPAGISVTLEDAQLLRTPPAIEPTESDFPEDSPLGMGAQDIERLPISFEEKAAQPSLPENSIKIYNYTNSQSFSGGLDAYLPDRLVLSPSSETGGVIYGDCISVYGDSALNQILGEGTADSEGAVSIDLGNKLKAEGGKVYLTNRRAGVASSAVAFSYPPEAKRNITFRIYRTALPTGVEEGTDPRTKPEALQKIQQGEQLQIRIYFNDINDLMGYTFPIHFNTLAVRAADRYFRPIEKDGYLTESEFFNGKTPFSVGADIRELTTTELIIYYAQESEIPGLMEQLGIATREEWDRKKQDIQVKLEFGASPDHSVWNGGLLFTGPRDGGTADGGAGQSITAYPYVDNNAETANAGNDGLIKLWATSLTSPMSRLEREGGYHFLTLNFTGVTNASGESAEFRFADKTDAVYDSANPDGGRLVVSGPEAGAGRNISVNWEVRSMEEIPIPQGTTVGGIVTSWNPSAITTITLLQNGEAVQTVTAGGIEAAAAEGYAPEAVQPFRLTGIMPGTYTLRIQKESHLDVVIEELEVDETVLDLTQSANPRLRSISLPCGDVDGDGHIGLKDRSLLLLSKHYGVPVGVLHENERAAAKRLDLDGDGFIKKRDLQILMSAANFGKSTIHINAKE